MSPGDRIRWFRENRPAGQPALTQAICAARTGYSVGHWRKWERGDRHPSLEQWAQIARVLDVNDLYDLTGMAHAVLPDQYSEHRAVAPILDAMVGVRTGAAIQDADQFRGVVTSTWGEWQGNEPGRYSRIGGLLPELIADGEATVRNLDGAQRRDAYASLAQLYQLTWSYLRAVGAPDLGVTAGDRARAAGEAADRPESLAAGIWGNAAILSSARHPEASLALSLRLIADHEGQLGNASTELRSIIGQAHLLGAVQYARLHRPDKAEELLNRAAIIADRVGEGNASWTAFGPTNVDMHRTTVQLERCRYGTAITLGSNTDVDRSPSVERRVAHRVHLAHSYACDRQPLAAVTTLLRAFQDSAEETRSLMLTRDTAESLRRKQTPDIFAPVAQVLELLNAA
jgi:transcriptional regulator with XRE-family HTH domain